ncbi:hypothetical protein [Terracidiphilus sp.]|uniref:hypothetical protein n=1 Tax=Terracidiphilus sp. TaxID=1964191 RepID=UPI003C1B8FAA
MSTTHHLLPTEILTVPSQRGHKGVIGRKVCIECIVERIKPKSGFKSRKNLIIKIKKTTEIGEMLSVIVGRLFELVARLGMEVPIWAVKMCVKADVETD